MELEILKKELNKDQPKYSRQEIQSIFEIKTKRAVGSMNRVMFFDLIIMTMLATAMIALTFIINLQDRYFISLQILLVAGVLYLHYAIKRKVIYNQLSNNGIKNSIENILYKMNVYVNIYKGLVPIIICSIYIKTSVDIAQSFKLSNELYWGILLTTLPFGYGAYKLTCWLANRLYRPTIERLNQLNNKLFKAFK
ncbi:MAG: hypothetical protein ABJH05_10710 [Fulvivirga sp.]